MQTTKASPAWLLRLGAMGALFLITCGAVQSATTNAPLTAEQMFEGGDKVYTNWVEFSGGGVLTRGNEAQAAQRLRLGGNMFGGLEDLHYQQNTGSNTTLYIDGRALLDEHDYKLSLNLKREEFGYLRFNYENFRTWDNPNGGYYTPTGQQYSMGTDPLHIDRGEFAFEGGLTLKKLPKITFGYTHRYREGEKSSTSWGVTTPAIGQNRGLLPSFYDISERSDHFKLDVTHRIKATDVGLGLRVETGNLDNALKTEAANSPQKVTDRQGTTYDMVSLHAFSETWLKKNLLLSSGFMFANLENNFTGRRIYGNDFDVSTVPAAGMGYSDISGGSHKQEYVLNLNLMSILFTNFTIVPSIRAMKEDFNADSSGIGTQTAATGAYGSESDRESLDVRERLDLRYTGVNNWVFSGAGEWTQGEGNTEEKGGLTRVTLAAPVPILRETEDSRRFQKYSLNAKWYPTRRITLDFGGYYKFNKYNYNSKVDNTPNAAGGDRYPAFLVMHNFETLDGNTRLTLRPRQNVTLVSRYEYQLSTVTTAPDSSSGLDRLESSRMKSHIIGQNISWTPWTRLSLQAGFNYVLSKTHSPVSDSTRVILDSQNNYWTLNFNSSLVVDDKTDLNLGYYYYRADNFKENLNPATGQPYGVYYGADAQEHGVTALLSRRIKPNLRLNLKYGFYHYDSIAYGGNNNFDAHVIHSSLQYRF